MFMSSATPLHCRHNPALNDVITDSIL